MELNINSTKKLNNDVEIPRLGFGTYRIKADKIAVETVTYALETGYRHVDTATAYQNEKGVGKAIKESGIPREDIFITTKLWNEDHGYDSALRAFDVSLKKLGTGYIDLYLIHWPVSRKRIDSWKALEKIYNDGRARSIGVSNFTINHLKELLSETEIVPVINQVEFHPFLYQKELMNFCREKNIAIEAYSPVVRAKKFNNPVLKDTAQKYSKTPAQILIRWGLQHDLITIPKSSNRERIEENADVFSFNIQEDDMQKLNNLNEDYRVSWSPVGVE